MYDYNAPTKQNILCNRKSVRDVLRDHPDFSTGDALIAQEKGNILATKIRNKNSFAIEILRQVWRIIYVSNSVPFYVL